VRNRPELLSFIRNVEVLRVKAVLWSIYGICAMASASDIVLSTRELASFSRGTAVTAAVIQFSCAWSLSWLGGGLN